MLCMVGSLLTISSGSTKKASDAPSDASLALLFVDDEFPA